MKLGYVKVQAAPTRAMFGSGVHLVSDGADRHTLCGLRALGQWSREPFQHAGCRACASAAVAQGITSLREYTNSHINLRRFLQHTTDASPRA